MILNTAIFLATVTAARVKSAGNASILRAIDRAVVEIERAKYWSFADGVLTIISTTSSERYVIGDDHTCPAQSKTCKHLVARRLMQCYFKRLAEADAKPTTPQAAPVADEREALMAEIKANWQRRNPEYPLGLALQKRFGWNRLESVHPDYLPQIAAALK